MPTDTPSRYGALSQALHWATAILVLVAFIFGPGGSEENIYAASRDFERQIHETLGLSVFVLVIVRVLWRLVAAQPEPVPMARWMHLLAASTHGLLYLLLFTVPLTAITGAWLEGHPLTLLAGLEIAPRLTTAHDLGATISEVHGWLGDTILWLAGLHAAAAIYHHLVLKDGVLLSMLPSRRR